MTTRLTALCVLGLLAGCASQPKLTPMRVESTLATLPETCAGAEQPPGLPAGHIIPGGITLVQSGGSTVIVVAARGCVMTVDAATGAVETLPTRGDTIGPTMVSAGPSGLAFSSSLSGSVRVIDTHGAVVFNVSGLLRPLGLGLLPGGVVVVAEHAANRLVRLGPTSESRARVIAEKLGAPVGVAVLDATGGYVTENMAGRVSRFNLDRFETSTVASGLDHPEGIALMPDGRLAVAEVGKRRLVAVDPKTGVITVLADNLPIGQPADQPDDPNVVTDVAAGGDGTLYVSSDLDRSILRITPRPAPARK